MKSVGQGAVQLQDARGPTRSEVGMEKRGARRCSSCSLRLHHLRTTRLEVGGWKLAVEVGPTWPSRATWIGPAATARSRWVLGRLSACAHCGLALAARWDCPGPVWAGMGRELVSLGGGCHCTVEAAAGMRGSLPLSDSSRTPGGLRCCERHGACWVLAVVRRPEGLDLCVCESSLCAPGAEGDARLCSPCVPVYRGQCQCQCIAARSSASASANHLGSS